FASPTLAQETDYATLLVRAADAPPAAAEAMRLLGDALRSEDWSAAERLLTERRASLAGMDDWTDLLAARAAAGRRQVHHSDWLVAGSPAWLRQRWGWAMRTRARRGDAAATRAFALGEAKQGGAAGARGAWAAVSQGAEPAAPLLLQALRNGDVA